MPSVRGSSGGRSFGGSHFSRSSSRSFGGSHFNRGSSSSSFGGSVFGRSRSGSHYRPSLRWRPHTTVIFGRPVYFGATRAKASSILSLLLVLGVLAAIVMGCLWGSAESDLTYIRDLYPYYANMIEKAELDPDYQINARVVDYEEYGDTGRYCIYYDFYGDSQYDGFSFCHYSREEVIDLKGTTIILAIDTINAFVDEYTDSVPMMDKNYLLLANMEDDMEYVDTLATRDMWRIGTLVAAGISGLLIVASVLVSMTAKKATEEQIAETEKAKTESANATESATETKAQTWRCAYCGSLNDNSKHSCDGCGANRQK